MKMPSKNWDTGQTNEVKDNPWATTGIGTDESRIWIFNILLLNLN